MHFRQTYNHLELKCYICNFTSAGLAILQSRLYFDITTRQETVMGIASFIIGLFSLAGMGIGLIPLLGTINFFNFFLALIGLGLGVGGMLRSPRHRLSLLGMVLCGLSLVLGFIKYILG